MRGRSKRSCMLEFVKLLLRRHAAVGHQHGAVAQANLVVAMYTSDAAWARCGARVTL